MSAKLLGVVPKLNIDSDEANIMIESLDYDGSSEWYESKNKDGRMCGSEFIDEAMGFNMTGALPRNSTKTSFKLGASLVLANTPPGVWSETPTATVAVIKNVKYGSKAGDAQTVDVSGSVYPFAEVVTTQQSSSVDDNEVI